MKILGIMRVFILVLLYVGQVWSADWYVRPLVGGPYGAADGTSYNTAWAGFANVVWGVSGVQAGDTLWIGGDIWGDVATDYQTLYASTTLTVGASGSGEDARITIRGDVDNAPDANANGHNAVVYHVSRGFTDNWTDTGTNGVFTHTAVSAIGWMFEIVSGVWTSYTTHAAGISDIATWTPGTWYLDGTTLYIKTPSGTSPNTNHQINVYLDPFIIINGRDYVTIKNIELHGGGGCLTLTNANYITIDNITLNKGFKAIILNDNCDNCIVKNCNISEYGEGIYTVKSTGYSDNLLLENNTISYVIETNRYGKGADCHSIGLQGGMGSIIRNNTIYNGNSGIYLYNSTGYPASSCSIYNNYIYNIRYGSTVHHGEGIVAEGNNVDVVNFSVYNNIIKDSTVGIKLGAKTITTTTQEAYNNTLYRNQYNIVVAQSTAGLTATIKNNIIVSPYNYGDVLAGIYGNTAVACHVYVYDASTYPYATWNLVIDYNNYYPSGVFYFDDNSTPYPGHGTENFSTWSGHVGGQESHSDDNSDPLFVNAGGSFALATDFKLQPLSPCVNTGTPVTGITTDYGSAARPQ